MDSFHQKNQVLDELAKRVSSDGALVQLLARSYDPAARSEFACALRSLLSSEGQKVITNPWEGFMTYCA